MEIKTTIIIPNYNGLSFMEPCFESLKEQTVRDFKVLVVDNGSTDGSVEWLKEHRVPSIFLKENTGFSGAVNTGIRAADTPYVLLLNNDTRVEPGFVAAMERAMDQSPKIFSVSSRMIQMYHPELHGRCRRHVQYPGLGVSEGCGPFCKALPEVLPGLYAPVPERPFTAGLCLMRSAYFDELHFAYLEDIDVGWRAKLYGYDNVYCPDAAVYHVGSGTSGSRYNSFKVRLAARNCIYLNYKNMPGWQILLNAPFLLAGIFVKYLFFVKNGFGRDYVSGLKEGIRTRKQCRRVPGLLRRFSAELKVQFEMICGTGLYVYEFLRRQAAKRK